MRKRLRPARVMSSMVMVALKWISSAEEKIPYRLQQQHLYWPPLLVFSFGSRRLSFSHFLYCKTVNLIMYTTSDGCRNSRTEVLILVYQLLCYCWVVGCIQLLFGGV